MSMSFKGKAAQIDLSDLDAGTTTPRPANLGEAGQDRASTPRPLPPTTKARSGVDAISQSISVRHRVQDLEQKLVKYEEAGVVVLLDPRRIRHSRWKNRHEGSYSTAEFAQLKADIASAGRNVQPIKVRRVAEARDGQDEYELVYGRRRHRACLELGLPVASVVQQVTDVELFLEADRENRQRADLTPYEQGAMYADALAQGLFPSQRNMAQMLGVDHALVSKAIRLASLPDFVISAFASPLELQFRWGEEIADALAKDPQRVQAIAEGLCGEVPRRSAREVYSALVGLGAASPRKDVHEIASGGKVVAEWTKGAGGSATIKVRPGVLTQARERKLVQFLQGLFD